SRAPEGGVDVAEVTASIRVEPCVLDCITQVLCSQISRTKPARDLCLECLAYVGAAIGQMVERQRRFVPTACLHVVHVVAESPEPERALHGLRRQREYPLYDTCGAYRLLVCGDAEHPSHPVPVTDTAGLRVHAEPP